MCPIFAPRRWKTCFHTEHERSGIGSGLRCDNPFRRRSSTGLVSILCCAWLLSACDYFFPPPEERYKAIDVYEDRYEYRFSSYTSLRRLAIALEASTDELREVNVRECVDEAHLIELLDLLRAHGQVNVAVSLPDNC